MSGFFGMVREDGKPVEEPFLQRIAEKLSFRGLDGKSVWLRDNIGGTFAFMRTGPGRQASQQPVIWQERYFLWGDIRLDGRKELEGQLAEIGQVVESDTTSEELLLYAWAAWGDGALERMIGDFSFALWDAQEQTLWCARDFIGARPLYFAYTRGVFCFSNTLDILRTVPEVSGELDELFVADFLVEGWIVELNRTIYRDIRRVAPGTVLKYSKDGEVARRFRQLPIEQPLKFKYTEEYLEAYRVVLRSAVSDRLPEGATSLYLSGGLDSSSVCAMAAQIASPRGQNEKLKAFTLSWEAYFDDPEPAFAKNIARHLGIALEVLEDSKLVPFEGAEAGEVRCPEPGHELFFARKRRQAQRVALHSNVVLGGDGGDDVQTGQAWPHLVQLSQRGDWKEIARVFGGYFWSQKRIPPLRRGFRRKMRRLLKKEDPFAGYPEWLNDDFATRLNLKERWLESRNQNDEPSHPYHPRAYRALHDGYWGEVLEAEDAGWTRVRLETRSPLLDLRVLTFLLRLPPVPWCMDKKIGRDAMKNSLPFAVVNRPKTPLLRESLDLCADNPEWISMLPMEAPFTVNRFVNWTKWCETFYHPKGSLSWIILRPVSLLYWSKAVENDQGIQ